MNFVEKFSTNVSLKDLLKDEDDYKYKLDDADEAIINLLCDSFKKYAYIIENEERENL